MYTQFLVQNVIVLQITADGTLGHSGVNVLNILQNN